jgi:hypothetical protein
MYNFYNMPVIHLRDAVGKAENAGIMGNDYQRAVRVDGNFAKHLHDHLTGLVVN